MRKHKLHTTYIIIVKEKILIFLFSYFFHYSIVTSREEDLKSVILYEEDHTMLLNYMVLGNINF